MNLYSHYYLAGQVAVELQPQDPAEYYWGALIPDVRYLAGLRRETTHRSRETLAALAEHHPELASFLLGYRVHCLLDEIELTRVLGQRMPFRLAGRRLRLQHYAILVEFYFLQKARPLPPVSGRHNVVLDEMGITEKHTLAFAGAVRQYAAEPGLPAALAASKTLGLAGDQRVERYLQAALWLDRYRFLQKPMVWGVRAAHLEELAGGYVLKALANGKG